MVHHGEVQRFVDDDRGYLRWLVAHADLFVLNIHRNPTPTYPIMLHRSTCGTINGTPARGSRWTGDYVKVCGTRYELENFARGDVGGEAQPCGLCLKFAQRQMMMFAFPRILLGSGSGMRAAGRTPSFRGGWHRFTIVGDPA
jgi:hypothetical protein